MMEITITVEESYGSKPLYAGRGYCGDGYILGCNTPYGGRYVWVRRTDQ